MQLLMGRSSSEDSILNLWRIAGKSWATWSQVVKDWSIVEWVEVLAIESVESW